MRALLGMSLTVAAVLFQGGCGSKDSGPPQAAVAPEKTTRARADKSSAARTCV
jgi:hypothetical protein